MSVSLQTERQSRDPSMSVSNTKHPEMDLGCGNTAPSLEVEHWVNPG